MVLDLNVEAMWKRNITLRMALSGCKVFVRKAATECLHLHYEDVCRTVPAAADGNVKVQDKWLEGRR